MLSSLENYELNRCLEVAENELARLEENDTDRKLMVAHADLIRVALPHHRSSNGRLHAALVDAPVVILDNIGETLPGDFWVSYHNEVKKLLSSLPLPSSSSSSVLATLNVPGISPLVQPASVPPSLPAPERCMEADRTCVEEIDMTLVDGSFAAAVNDTADSSILNASTSTGAPLQAAATRSNRFDYHHCKYDEDEEKEVKVVENVGTGSREDTSNKAEDGRIDDAGSTAIDDGAGSVHGAATSGRDTNDVDDGDAASSGVDTNDVDDGDAASSGVGTNDVDDGDAASSGVDTNDVDDGGAASSGVDTNDVDDGGAASSGVDTNDVDDGGTHVNTEQYDNRDNRFDNNGNDNDCDEVSISYSDTSVDMLPLVHAGGGMMDLGFLGAFQSPQLFCLSYSGGGLTRLSAPSLAPSSLFCCPCCPEHLVHHVVYCHELSLTATCTVGASSTSRRRKRKEIDANTADGEATGSSGSSRMDLGSSEGAGGDVNGPCGTPGTLPSDSVLVYWCHAALCVHDNRALELAAWMCAHHSWRLHIVLVVSEHIITDANADVNANANANANAVGVGVGVGADTITVNGTDMALSDRDADATSGSDGFLSAEACFARISRLHLRLISGFRTELASKYPHALLDILLQEGGDTGFSTPSAGATDVVCAYLNAIRSGYDHATRNQYQHQSRHQHQTSPLSPMPEPSQCMPSMMDTSLDDMHISKRQRQYATTTTVTTPTDNTTNEDTAVSISAAVPISVDLLSTHSPRLIRMLLTDCLADATASRTMFTDLEKTLNATVSIIGVGTVRRVVVAPVPMFTSSLTSMYPENGDEPPVEIAVESLVAELRSGQLLRQVENDMNEAVAFWPNNMHDSNSCSDSSNSNSNSNNENAADVCGWQDDDTGVAAASASASASVPPRCCLRCSLSCDHIVTDVNHTNANTAVSDMDMNSTEEMSPPTSMLLPASSVSLKWLDLDSDPRVPCNLTNAMPIALSSSPDIVRALSKLHVGGSSTLAYAAYCESTVQMLLTEFLSVCRRSLCITDKLNVGARQKKEEKEKIEEDNPWCHYCCEEHCQDNSNSNSSSNSNISINSSRNNNLSLSQLSDAMDMLLQVLSSALRAGVLSSARLWRDLVDINSERAESNVDKMEIVTTTTATVSATTTTTGSSTAGRECVDFGFRYMQSAVVTAELIFTFLERWKEATAPAPAPVPSASAPVTIPVTASLEPGTSAPVNQTHSRSTKFCGTNWRWLLESYVPADFAEVLAPWQGTYVVDVDYVPYKRTVGAGLEIDSPIIPPFFMEVQEQMQSLGSDAFLAECAVCNHMWGPFCRNHNFNYSFDPNIICSNPRSQNVNPSSHNDSAALHKSSCCCIDSDSGSGSDGNNLGLGMRVEIRRRKFLLHWLAFVLLNSSSSSASASASVWAGLDCAVKECVLLSNDNNICDCSSSSCCNVNSSGTLDSSGCNFDCGHSFLQTTLWVAMAATDLYHFLKELPLHQQQLEQHNHTHHQERQEHKEEMREMIAGEQRDSYCCCSLPGLMCEHGTLL